LCRTSQSAPCFTASALSSAALAASVAVRTCAIRVVTSARPHAAAPLQTTVPSTANVPRLCVQNAAMLRMLADAFAPPK
jgi:hypothetical protein